ILNSLEGQLDILQPSNFEYMDMSAADAMNKAIFPITSETRTVGGMSPAQLRSHTGGVAIVLKDMNPTLSAAEIKDRMEQVRLQPQADSAKMQAYRDVDVEVSSDGKTAVVMTSDPAITYEPNDPTKLQQWTDDIVKPTWANILE